MNSTPKLQELLSKLQNVKASGQGYSARCPAHPDKRVSLSVSQGDDGRALVYCHAGCAVDSICSAIGLTVADLMPSKNGKPERNGKREIVATYDYCDENGNLLFQVVRYDPKDFRQRKPKPDGGWSWSVKDVKVVPYRLPELLAQPEAPIFVVEGEKDVESLASIGAVATCNAGGAGKWTKEHAHYLKDRTVIVLPDNDKPGRDHAEKVARTLVGVATSIKLVALSGLPEKGDVTDWIESHGEAAEPSSIREELLDLAKRVKEYQAVKPKLPSICIADIETKAVDWLWDGYLPRGMITLIDGDPGLGKSFLSINLAARVSRGLAMPPDGGKVVSDPAGVLLCNAEDDPARTIRPRLEAAGAEITRIHLPDFLDEAGTPRPMVLPDDLLALESLIVAHEVHLVVIDPLMAFLTGKADSHKDSDIRRILHRMKDLAERTQSAFLVIRHLNKMVTVSEPIYRGGGSIGIIGAARSAFLVGQHPEQEKVSVLARIKGNLCAAPPALAFSIERNQVAWIGELDLTAKDLLSRNGSSGRRPDAIETAKKFLTHALAKGGRFARDIEAEAQKEKISISTLKRAKRELEIQSTQAVIGGPWTWTLPPECQKTPTQETSGTLAENPQNQGLFPESHNSGTLGNEAEKS